MANDPDRKPPAKADKTPWPVQPRHRRGYFLKGCKPGPGAPKLSEKVYRAKHVFEQMLFKGLTRRGVTRSAEILDWLLTREDPRIVMETYFRMLEYFAPKAAQTVKVQDETAALERAFMEIWRDRENRRRVEVGLPLLPESLTSGNGGQEADDASIDAEFRSIAEAREPSNASVPKGESEPESPTASLDLSEPSDLSVPSGDSEPSS
jgi:hypothetical protein